MRRLLLACSTLACSTLACSTPDAPKAPEKPAWSVTSAAAVRSATSMAPALIRAPARMPPRLGDPAAANDACADCHPDQVESYQSTGMGRSLSPVKVAPVIEDFAKATVTHAPTGLVYTAVRDADGRYWQEERVPGTDFVRRIEATHVIGSGNHTRSYLGERDGELVQLPLTWYAGRKIWDLSPGYQKPNQPRFSRVVEPACLFCHNGLTPLKPNTRASYQEPLAAGIGCDRCHGDGAAHVALRGAGKGPAPGQQDPSIFNPARQSPQRQLQVCQQCHLQADASIVHGDHRWDHYDVRFPLDQYVSVFRKGAAGGDSFGIASHGRRLAASRCATESDGALTCTGCHNPHATATPSTYRAACQACHGEQGRTTCSDPAGAKPDAHCAGCHMRSGGTSDVPHVTFTDHFIRRRPKPDPAPKGSASTTLHDLVAGAAPLNTPEGQLRVGLGHTWIWERSRKTAHLPEAINTLTAALSKTSPGTPGLARGYAALGRGLMQHGESKRALQAFAQARRYGISDPNFPEDHATALEAAGQMEAAKTTLQAAIAQRPSADRWWRLAMLHLRGRALGPAKLALEAAARLSTTDPRAVAELGALALRDGQMDVARGHLEEALKRDARSVPARLRLGLLELQTQRPAQAEAVLDRLIAQTPLAPPAWLLRGQARAAQGKHDQALDDFTKVIELAPDRPEGYLQAAELALKTKRIDEATSLLTMAAAKFPKDPRFKALLQKAVP